MDDWKSVNLRGAGNIERICNVYEIYEHGRVPGGYFKIKVMETREGTYDAVANVALKGPDGASRGRAGMGNSEVEALQNCLRMFMEHLDERAEYDPDDFYWSDPVRF